MGFGSYKTAWYMCHKVRAALMRDIDKLGGIVEVDETFVGGKAKNRHWDKRGGGGGTGGIGSGKTPVVGAVSRKGNVVARVIASVQAATLTAFVREAVSHKVSLLCTDQWAGYRRLDKEYPHATVDQRGPIRHRRNPHQTIEGFWSIFKRGVVGTFHKMSRKYMPLYVAEFQFRYNNRDERGHLRSGDQGMLSCGGRKWLIISCIALMALVTVSWFIPNQYNICTNNEYTNQKECAAYNIAPFIFL